ncbi:glutamine synthetase family protein [Novosphingobium rosa]|uniref:glutamine synthetase family protein n=1 Tax=Novosphingobium rosa TaxID=76978 RepID=UPI000835EACF|nr:glutamine synthetase family protein [Novosphingobium rosa]
MTCETLIFAATCDLAGHVRGKAFPSGDLPSRLKSGVGYTGSNIMLSAFGPIYATPFGTKGDLKLVPDEAALASVPGLDGKALQLALGDIRNLDGSLWSCCPRSFLKRAVAAMEDEFGLRLLSTFEQEFIYTGVEAAAGSSYAFDMYRRSGLLGEAIMTGLRTAGIAPDSFLPEAGDRQFEVTIDPAEGTRSADQAVLLREVVRGCAANLGARAILAPLLSPDGTSSGTHIHLSLRDLDGKPAMHDPQGLFGLSEAAQHFAAGIIAHMPAITALTAPSVSSYYRLRPDKWAPTWANIAAQDRGASLRVCPVTATTPEGIARQFNVEFRVVDAAASPYMALGAILHAGLDGLRNKLALPAHPQEADADYAAAGVSPLPASLGEALDRLEASSFARAALGEALMTAYVMLKRSEIAALDGLTEQQVCDRYAEVY